MISSSTALKELIFIFFTFPFIFSFHSNDFYKIILSLSFFNHFPWPTSQTHFKFRLIYLKFNFNFPAQTIS